MQEGGILYYFALYYENHALNSHIWWVRAEYSQFMDMQSYMRRLSYRLTIGKIQVPWVWTLLKHYVITQV